jgi:hypothetical protein
MGLWDAITDAADAVGDAVSDAAESAYDTVASSSLGDAIARAGETVDTATFGMASRAMNAADDYVFDTVDYVTRGGINVDFDDGQFSVGAGFDGLARVGASVGEAGITTSGEALIGGSYELGMTDAGFTAAGSAGIDWGPLPYAAGHVKLGANGDVSVNGELQGTVPTPYGVFSGDLAGGFTSTDQGWGTYIDTEGSWQTPTGITFGGGFAAGYEETAAGSHTSVEVEGSVSYMGMATVGGSVGYDRLEHDGDVVEGVSLEGQVDALGMSVNGQADYMQTNIDGVEQSEWSGDADFDGPELADVAQTIGKVASSEFGASDVLGSDDVLGGVASDPPMDDFGAAIQSADSIDASMDSLIEDLQ